MKKVSPNIQCSMVGLIKISRKGNLGILTFVWLNLIK